jgi:hypothetical protein
MQPLRLIASPGAVELEMDREGVKSACRILGWFKSQELLEAAFSGVAFTASIGSSTGCVHIDADSVTLLKPYSSYVKTEGAGSVVSGRIMGISALARSKKSPPTWCIRVEALNEAQDSIALPVVIQGMIKYRYLFRQGGRVTLNRLQRVMVEENMTAYLAIDGASVVSSYRHPSGAEELELTVLRISDGSLVCETAELSRLTLEVSDWASGQNDALCTGAVIAVSNYVVLGPGCLSLCRHGSLVVTHLPKSSECADSLRVLQGCPQHRTQLGWSNLSGAPILASACSHQRKAFTAWTALVGDCRCFADRCDIELNYPPLILLATYSGVLELDLRGRLNADMTLSDLSLPEGLAIVTHGIPNFGDSDANSAVIIDHPRMTRGAILLSGFEPPPLRHDETVALVTRTDRLIRRVDFVTGGSSKVTFAILPVELFCQMEPLCWVAISMTQTIRRLAGQTELSGRLTFLALRAASAVIRCGSFAEARRCKPGSVLYLPKILILESSPYSDLSAIPSLYSLKAPVQKLTVACLDDSTREPFAIFAQTCQWREISLPVLCDLHEVAWLGKPEGAGVLLSSGKVTLRSIQLPHEVILSSVDLQGHITLIESIQAFLKCRGCSKVTPASMACSCGWPVGGVKLGVKAVFNFAAALALTHHRFEAADDLGDVLLSFCEPSVSADLLGRLVGKRACVVVKVEAGIQFDPPVPVSLTVIQGATVHKIQKLSRESWVRKRLD